MTAIICEYNPFHRGHARHIARTRAAFPDSPLVCIMSGNFVQRGDAAVLPKHARAETALYAGADLVVELPMPYAVAGAQGFAGGAVAVAAALGVDTLSFGSESGDLDGIRRTAALLEREDFKTLLKTALGTGITFAAARAAVVRVLEPELERYLSTPNDILAVEYCCAAQKAGIGLYAVPRTGAGHDEPDARGDSLSASALRARLREGRADAAAFMPAYADAIVQHEIAAGRAPVSADALDRVMLAGLRELSPEGFARFSDATEGLENRLWRAVRESGTMAAACAAAKTKRYPYARIRRAYWNAFLRIPAPYCREEPPFVRVLGLTPAGGAVLARCRLPVLTKPAKETLLPPRAREWFALDERAGDLYALAFPKEENRAAGYEKRCSPVYVDRS